jgi:hypothetical protein
MKAGRTVCAPAPRASEGVVPFRGHGTMSSPPILPTTPIQERPQLSVRGGGLGSAAGMRTRFRRNRRIGRVAIPCCELCLRIALPATAPDFP